MTICYKCNRQLGFFSKKVECKMCHHTFCSSCVDKITISPYMRDLLVGAGLIEFEKTFFNHYYLCSSCMDAISTMICKMQNAINSNTSVEFVSNNYHGYKSYVGDPISISTVFYRDLHDCENDLAILARYYDCDMVIHL